VEVPKLASEADREQQSEPGADVDSSTEVRCRNVPMNPRVSNSVSQYATFFAESISEAHGCDGGAQAWLTNWARNEGVTNNVARLVTASSCAPSTL
jgi:hypothetical protein